MPEPTTTSFLGVKYMTLAAGFAGGVVSLSYVRELSRLQSALAVLNGALAAAYVTPAAAQYLSIPPGGTENFVAFVIGLTAMNLIPGALALADRWAKNPSLPGGGK